MTSAVPIATERVEPVKRPRTPRPMNAFSTRHVDRTSPQLARLIALIAGELGRTGGDGPGRGTRADKGEPAPQH